MNARVDALILLRLHARAGRMVGVQELADLLQVSVQTVSERVQCIEKACGLHVRYVADLPFSVGVSRLRSAPAAGARQ